MDRLFLPLNQMRAQRGTVPSLDGLRAISIGLVLSAHFIDDRLFPGGLGVFIFFVISGFLITRLLIMEHDATGNISITSFYTRRIFRLYPVIVVFSACMVGLYLALGYPVNLTEPLSALAYFANYLYVYFETHYITVLMPFQVFWSLSVEEHFYIVFPLMFILFRGRPVPLLCALGCLCVACLALRMVVATLHPEYLTTQAFYTESQYRIDSIAFGVVLALACQIERGRDFVRRLAGPVSTLTASGVLVATLLVRDPWFRETLRYTVQGCAILVIVAAVLFSDKLRVVQLILNSAPLVWVGRLSYSLYVWHEGVASLLPTAAWPHWLVAAANCIATLAVATISYYGVEQPFLRLRRYLPRPQLAHLPAHQRLSANSGA